MSRLGPTSHTFCGLNTTFMNVKSGGTYSSHWAYFRNFRDNIKYITITKILHTAAGWFSDTFLCAFEAFRKPTISSLCLSVHMELLGLHWTIFHEI
jgi:hypothetical protein